jgi:hypothetical protein
VGEEPEEEAESGAQDETGDDGEVESGMLAAADDVAGEFSQVEGEFGTEVEQGTDEEGEAAENEQRAAEITERVHGGSVKERSWEENRERYLPGTFRAATS